MKYIVYISCSGTWKKGGREIAIEGGRERERDPCEAIKLI